MLVLATLWPEFWDTLTARPAGGADPHAQARELLAGHDITVPAAFTPAQMSQLARAADVRLALAARSAPDGEVIQFLAGAPELLARYRNAPPAAAALIHAAMDARRLGMGAGLPQAFLEAAAPGYLTDDQWDALGEDWLEQALAYTAVPCKGARGPLTRIRPRPARPAARHRGDQPASMAAAAGPLYRLADYLDQHGRAHRASQIPPAEFWSAAAAHAAPGDLEALGIAAFRRAYIATPQTYTNKPVQMVTPARLPTLLPSCAGGIRDRRPADWAVAHAALDDAYEVGALLNVLLWKMGPGGAMTQIDVLAGARPSCARRYLSAYDLTCRSAYYLTCWFAGGLAGGLWHGRLVSVARSLFFIRQLGPLMVMTSQWWRNRLRMAVARTSLRGRPGPILLFLVSPALRRSAQLPAATTHREGL